MTTDRTAQFRALHESGTFVMPNPWDVGSARILASLGFPALATTSSGHAATFGRLDQHVTRDELLAHAEAVAAAVEVPLNVDAEGCFAGDPGGVARTVELIGQTGAAGCSLEDYDPVVQAILPIDVATERVASAVDAARASGLVLTARAENHLYGQPDVDDTIARLQAYAAAGARRASTRPGWPAWRTSAGSWPRSTVRSTCWPCREGRPSPRWPRWTSAASPPAASSPAPPTAPW